MVKVQIPIRGLQRCLFAGQIVNISRQGLIYIPAMFVLGAIIHETGLIWAQPVADVLSLALSIAIVGGILRQMKAMPDKEATRS